MDELCPTLSSPPCPARKPLRAKRLHLCATSPLLALLCSSAMAMPAPMVSPSQIIAPQWPDGSTCATNGRAELLCQPGSEDSVQCSVSLEWDLTAGPQAAHAGQSTGELWGLRWVLERIECLTPQGGWVDCWGEPAAAQGDDSRISWLQGYHTRDSREPLATIPPGPFHKARARGTINLVPNRDSFGWVVPAIKARHPWLSGEARDTRYLIEISNINQPGCAPLAWNAQVSLPPDLQVSESSQALWTAAGEGVWRAVSSEPDNGLILFATTPTPLPIHGGPAIAAGARVDSQVAAHLRLAWEMAAPRWGIWSLAVETNARDDWRAVFAFEAASPFALIIPSFGLGLGLPIRGGPHGVRAGVRTQFTVSFPLVSVVVPLDFFPNDPNFADRFQASVLGQVSF